MPRPSFLNIILFIFILHLYITVGNASENNTDASESDYYKDFDFGNVISLDDTNSTSEIKKHDLLYLIFISPYCEECRKILPEYILASKYAEELKIPVKFAKIVTSDSPNITLDFTLTTLPSIFLMNKGEKIIYEGIPNKENLLKFANRKLHDDIFEYENLSEVKNHLENTSSLVIMSTLKDKELELYKSFSNYAKIDQTIDFISCITEECIKEYKEDIILFKKYDEKINKYTDEYGSISDAKNYAVKQFVGTYGVENGGVLTRNQVNMISEHKKDILFYFRNSSLEEHTKYDKIIKELGKELRKKDIYTAISDIEGDSFQSMVAKNFVIVKQDLPLIFFYDQIYSIEDGDLSSMYSIRHANEKQLTKEYIKEYVHKIMIGKIKKDIYSEAPLDNYDINGLKYVIGRTFDEAVIEEKNNVFLALIDGNSYNQGINEKVLSIMRNLVNKYKNEKEQKKVVFAYLDGSKNQVRGFRLTNEIPPILLLYKNTMTEKQVIKMDIKNIKDITEGEVEDFLYEKLNWGNRVKIENKEKDEKEEKKDKQSDL